MDNPTTTTPHPNPNPDVTTDRGTAAVIDRFNQAFRRHDERLLDGLIADRCVMETIGPAPDGLRYEGGETCLGFWRELARSGDSSFELEGVDVLGDRAIIRWRYRFGSDPASSVRGVNLMQVRDGQVVEALGYSKSGDDDVTDTLPPEP